MYEKQLETKRDVRKSISKDEEIVRDELLKKERKEGCGG